MDGDGVAPIRLMNFVSENQLEEAKRTRGARLEDGTAQRDRPLFEVLKENKDKKDAEFNERFKHRPPKALDEDETEFLDKLEMSRREYERQLADEEAQQLHRFKAAVAAQSVIVNELNEAPPPVPKIQDQNKLIGRKNPPPRSLGMVIKVKPQSKKAKVDQEKPAEKGHDSGTEKPLAIGDGDVLPPVAISGLVSYSDESEEDD